MIWSKVGKKICSILTQKEKWSFLNWLLEECVTNQEIPSFKKEFMQSQIAHELCFSKLEKRCERFVEDLVDWSFASDREKLIFKHQLIEGKTSFKACKTFLINGNLTEVERIMDFCLSSVEMKQQFKMRLAKHICRSLLKDGKCIWDQMNTILKWSVDAEEKIKDLKKDIFDDIAIYSHSELVIFSGDWEEIEGFYKWFCLSPAEIKQLKEDTVFKGSIIDQFKKGLFYFSGASGYTEALQWCLTDKKNVMRFKRIIEESCFTRPSCDLEQKVKRDFNYIVNVLLHRLSEEEDQDEASSDTCMEDKGDKRSVATEDESCFTRKRFK